MSKSIPIAQLSAEVQKVFEDYQELTFDQIQQAVEETAAATARDINERAKALFGGKKYKKSWKRKPDKTLRGRWKYSEIVYSSNGEYRVAHLLENGHAKRNGGRTAAQPHIAPAVEQAEETLVEAIKRTIG